KLLNQDSPAQAFGNTITGNTTTVPWLMTPEYASPEQVQGRAASVSTDIYSLGVLLYELLTGRLPYRVRDLLPHQIVHTICEIEPANPSLTVERMEETTNPQGDVTTFNPVTISELRSEPLDRLRRRLAGDLDNIVLMAIRKEQRHRYSSV